MDDLTQLWNQTFDDLFDRQMATPKGRYWPGRLCSSVVSTATAVSCLTLVKRNLPELYEQSAVFPESSVEGNEPGGDFTASSLDLLQARSLQYLFSQQNPDGGWGDTSLSYSNLAASWLAVSALLLNQERLSAEQKNQLQQGRAYLERGGRLAGLKRRYGKDKTFAVPILVNAALAGDVSWSAIPSLPFELACVPHKWLGLIRLPVVSYAIPALVAIGLTLHFHRTGWRARLLAPLGRLRRFFAVESLRVCRDKQPASGGFLEAAPLTAFVGMSLASISNSSPGVQKAAEPIIRDAVRFLVETARSDGSWPIDTNLAHWLTTLSGLAAASCEADQKKILDSGFVDLNWILANQNKRPHPFTQTAPGGWGWTNLSGSVPDADDTPGTLLLLSRFYANAPSEAVRQAARAGIDWLLNLQNRDGGWPTFCRGWGALPFDRSGVDLSAHAVRALISWRNVFPDLSKRLDRAVHAGFKFIVNSQLEDGSWVPLWFGNQDEPNEETPLYGTAKVLAAFRDFDRQTSICGGLVPPPGNLVPPPGSTVPVLNHTSVNNTKDNRTENDWTDKNRTNSNWSENNETNNDDTDSSWTKRDETECSGSENNCSLNSSTTWDNAEDLDITTDDLIPDGSARGGPGILTCNCCQKAFRYLISRQNDDGSFGTGGIEESALATEILFADSRYHAQAWRGIEWLRTRISDKSYQQAAPIGLYFAKLWYYEQLYPIIYTLFALSAARNAVSDD